MSVTQQPKVLQAEYFFYRIRRGDNLSTIAKKHRTTVSQLRRINNLSNRTMLSVGRTLKVPDQGGDGVQYVMEDASDSREPSATAVPASIAAKNPFTLSVAETTSRPYLVVTTSLSMSC